MRLRPDDLEAWKERVAQTVRPERRAPYEIRDDESQYQYWLWSRARNDLFALEEYGRPMPRDTEDAIATALAYRDGYPAESDSCCVQKMSGRWCDSSCSRWQR